MPMYEVEHVAQLSEQQKDQLAEAITTIHSRLFTCPVLFINVRFTDVRQHAMYVSGKRSNTNRIVGYVRPGGNRGREQFETLITQLGEAWTTLIERGADRSMGDVKLRATFINASIVAGKEKGFIRPQAGEDREWLAKNMPEFQKLADEGDKEMRLLVEEVKERGMI